MKKYISFFLFLIVLLSNNKLFALYPDANPYPYKKNAINTYIGVTYGSLVSESLGSYPGANNGNGGNKDRYQALWNPSHLFNAYNSSINLGIRFADNKNIFLNNLRFEAQYLNTLNQYSIIANTKNMKDQDTTKNPPAGYERLINGASLLMYYDIRSWSEVVYPYVGVGIGLGTISYKNVDTKEYYNGEGERYNANKRMPYGQLTLGVAYENKLIRSAFFFEYNIISTFSKITLNPSKDGITNAREPSEGESPIPTEVQTHAKDVRFLQHGISFGIRFYFS